MFITILNKEIGFIRKMRTYIKYKKIEKSNSEAMLYRDEVKDWIQKVLDESYDDLDYEVRQSEYNMHLNKINQLCVCRCIFLTYSFGVLDIQLLLRTFAC